MSLVLQHTDDQMALLTALYFHLTEASELFRLRAQLFALNIPAPEKLIAHFQAVSDALSEAHSSYLTLMSGPCVFLVFFF
jgi:hypothetical protein